jgi:acyl-homoserine-lactone acylase
MLFELWWNRYRNQLGSRDPHAIAWDMTDPFRTPLGLADPAVAAEAFAWAVPEATRRFGHWNVAWGEVNRVRRGNVDVPVGGCTGSLGCFRVLTLSNAPDGKRVATGGDGWIIAVEFGSVPRAYSVLAYGQSPDTASAWHANQAALFANNQLKPVAWTEADIAAATVQRYHPGDPMPER